MNSLLALMYFHCLNEVLEHLSHLAGLGVVAVGEDHKDIVQDEPLSPSAQGFQAFRPDVSSDRFLTHIKVGRRLRYGELFWEVSSKSV